MPEIGSNIFEKCVVPLVFEDRYFILEQEENEDIFSVFVLHQGKPVFEILRNQPQDNQVTEVSETPAGVITVGKKGKGRFLYKVRPQYKGTSVFGRIRGEETEIRITDTAINVGTNTVQRNMIVGYEVGIVIKDGGSIQMGAALPPEARYLFKER